MKTATQLQRIWRREWFKHNLRWMVPILLPLTVVLGFLFWWLEFYLDNPLPGTGEPERQQSVAVVTRFMPAYTSRGGRPWLPFLVGLHMDGTSTPLIPTAARLHKGQTVRVTYRVSRTGRLFVEHIEPIEGEQK